MGQNKELVCYRKKLVIQGVRLRAQAFSLVLGLIGELWVFRKNQKMSIASDQYSLSYEKKTTGGGGSN